MTVELWYHGTPEKLATIRAGSSLARRREIAEAFSHRPTTVSVDDDGTVSHNGRLDGFLYVVDEPVVPADVSVHPACNAGDPWEWVTARDLRVRRIARVPWRRNYFPYLVTHQVHLSDGVLDLRPLTEADWQTLLPWNQDPEVLYYSEGDPVQRWELADIQEIYRQVSQEAYCFMVELSGRPIGECWLQQMNVPRILRRYPEGDSRRIDLVIGEKELWGRGLGTRIIGLLTRFGFRQEGCDRIFAIVCDHNPRSRRAFEKAGFRLVDTHRNPHRTEQKWTYEWILCITKEEFVGQSGA